MLETFFNDQSFGPFIDNEFLTSPTKKLLNATEQNVEAALDVSEKGKKGLLELSHYERASILSKMASLLRAHKNAVAKWITLEMGKTIRDAKGEVEYAANYFDWFAEEAKRIMGYTVPSTNGDKKISVALEPIGTVAVITPWNFPIAMAARKIGPAIAAGCASIVKPSSTTPLSMLAVGAIAKEAGLPTGALGILPGDAEMISQMLLKDPRVRKLTFTGSTPVGEKLYAQCVSTFKKATMELGGHAPALIFEDADLERAVVETINAKLRVSGQTCVCANRIFVHRSIIEPFTTALVKKLDSFKIGDPLDETTDLTNVLHPSSMKKVPKQIEDALKKGAKCLYGGKEPYVPTVLINLTKDMEIFTEETFGPVFAIHPFETEEEAINLANDTIYGLAAYVFTNDITRAERVCGALEYGIIGLNDGLPTTPQAPFGGIKASGFGREGGITGLHEYLVEKTISLKL